MGRGFTTSQIQGTFPLASVRECWWPLDEALSDQEIVVLDEFLSSDLTTEEQDIIAAIKAFGITKTPCGCARCNLRRYAADGQ